MVFFKIMIIACIFIQPINNYKCLGVSFKNYYFTYIAKENWKEVCNSNNALKFSIPTRR